MSTGVEQLSFVLPAIPSQSPLHLYTRLPIPRAGRWTSAALHALPAASNHVWWLIAFAGEHRGLGFIFTFFIKMLILLLTLLAGFVIV
jgi:hypothetical protein